MKKEYDALREKLSVLYPSDEAAAITRLVFETTFHYTFLDLCMGKDKDFSEEERELFENIVSRLLRNEPVQYVLGHCSFCGLDYVVRPGVLIPRPETEELVHWVVADNPEPDKALLDLGTGSGCIAVSLAHLLPRAVVSACDISEQALEIARENALRHRVPVSFFRKDVLTESFEPEQWDVWVSNPPYIGRQEARDMDAHVLDFEPHLALFVPDEDPLLFYREIARRAQIGLKYGGRLYFEINRAYGPETVALLQELGFKDVRLKKDFFGNDRMIACRK